MSDIQEDTLGGTWINTSAAQGKACDKDLGVKWKCGKNGNQWDDLKVNVYGIFPNVGIIFLD